MNAFNKERFIHSILRYCYIIGTNQLLFNSIRNQRQWEIEKKKKHKLLCKQIHHINCILIAIEFNKYIRTRYVCIVVLSSNMKKKHWIVIYCDKCINFHWFHVKQFNRAHSPPPSPLPPQHQKSLFPHSENDSLISLR